MEQTSRDHSDDRSTTVIIPTRYRPHLLTRAIESVLAQTLQPTQILVVVDGPDEATVDSLRRFSVQQLQILALPCNLGVAKARNQAVRVAKGKWIALLDDDDEWLPTKLERQVHTAIRSQWPDPIVCSRVIVRSPEGDDILPRRSPRVGESIGDYLFCRRSILPGETFLQSSNLLTSRKLLQRIPFPSPQIKWEDIDWLLLASGSSDVGLEFVPEPLSIYYADHEKRVTMTGKWDWRSLLERIKERRPLISPRAYSGALLISIAHEAVREGDHRAGFALLREAVRYGQPDAIQLGIYLVLQLAHWTLPSRLRSQARSLLQRTGWQRRQRDSLLGRLPQQMPIKP